MQAGFKSGFFMAVLRKLLFSFFIVAAIFLFSAEKVFAQVVINEFSSGTTSDWVEIYNIGEPFEISRLKLIDASNNQKSFPNCLLDTNGTYSIDFSNWLNNGGDRITLQEGDLLMDCVSYGSGPICEGREIDLLALGATECGARQPEGSGGWVKITSSTKSDNSFCLVLPISTPVPTPTSTPTLTPTPTTKPPTPTPKPTATYKINEVKDNDGEVLSSVKVYVDGVYIHHYVPEVLTFCDDCQCDSYVSCGFGQHIIKLEKTGYEDWSKEITINSNTSDEVSPVMIFSEPNPTSTPTVLIKPTPAPTQKISPTPTPKKSNQTATDSGEVLGEEVSTISAFYPYEATSESEKSEATPSVRNKILPKIFLVGGLLLLFVSASWVWYNFKYTSRKA